MKIYLLAVLWFIPIISELFFQLPVASAIKECQPQPGHNKSGVANIVFTSVNAGQTWQDISEGLPENVEEGGSFASETGFYLRAGNETYYSTPRSISPFWKKEIFPSKWGSITPAKKGIIAYNYEGEILQKAKETNVWSPVYNSFHGRVRTVFETTGGNVLIGSDNGLYKSTNSGKTWRQVHMGGWVIKIVESAGVLVATSISGIIRSADDGETWSLVISEGGVGIDVAPIQGGFAAITFNTASNTRRLRASYDGGKTWQAIDAGLQGQSFNAPLVKPFSQVVTSDSTWNPNANSLPEEAFITSIVQAGGYFFCGHPRGIFRSADKGKTWKLVLPSVQNKVFYLSVSGNIIYAVPRNAGC